MSDYYDPLFKELAGSPFLGHLAPLKNISPINLQEPWKSSPVKIIHQAQFIAHFLKKYSPVRAIKIGRVNKRLQGEYDKYLDANNVSSRHVTSLQDSVESFPIESVTNSEQIGKLGDQLGYVPTTDQDTSLLQLPGDYIRRANGDSGIKIYTSGTSLVSASAPYITLPYIPSEVEVNSNATFAKINILNRNNVPYHFINGSKEISFTIDWHNQGGSLADPYNSSHKLELLTLMDGKKFPRKIYIVWGDNRPLFRGSIFYVKSAKLRLHQFHTAMPRGGNTPIEKDMILPSRVTQEITLVRVDPPGYWEHLTEHNNNKV